MPSLKELRNRINSVKSTRKITSAMKMVAASKLRRAQEQAEAGKPYAERMAQILSSIAGRVGMEAETPKLLAGTGKDDTYLVIAITADRGLCGAFNSQIVRMARRRIAELQAEGKRIKLLALGRKAQTLLRRTPNVEWVEAPGDFQTSKIAFEDVKAVADGLLADYEAGGEESGFDKAIVLYNAYVSVIKQEPSEQQLIPAALPDAPEANDNDAPAGTAPERLYEFEPDEATILTDLLPRNITVQLYTALLNSAAGEQAARMTAMDNATRNAGDMIGRLTLQYNRSRQAAITKELIEIISGAEAV